MNGRVKDAMFNLYDLLKMTDANAPRIEVWREDLEMVVNHLFHSVDEWSNQSALGYAIKAIETVGASRAGVRTLISVMQSEFDEMTVEEAADVYRKTNY